MRTIFYFFLMCSTLAIQAQNAVIKGIVKDKVTEFPLIGATVMIVDEDQNKGTTTDENGKFVIGSLSPGRYTLQISYLGYELSNIPNILATSGKETDLDIMMDEAVKMLDEVVVTATADKDQALN